MNSRRGRVALAAIVVAGLFPGVGPVWAQSGRPKVGDLVEYTSGLGPTLAEIVAEPDATGYVVVLLPTGKSVPVNPAKLRLIQPAGTPNAKVPVGTPATWSSGGYVEQGQVTKVNGNWCQVKTAAATTVGWLECKTLRTGQEASAAAAPQKESAEPAVALPPLLGKWESADGMAKLEFQKNGKCWISMGPMSSKCTYAAKASSVVITFDGEEATFHAEDDGSLSNDPDATIPLRFTRK